MKKENIKNKRDYKKPIMIAVMACALTLIGFLCSYAYFRITVGKMQNEVITAETGSLLLTFSDGDNGYQGSLNFGEIATKTFTIENNGSLDAVAQINWKNLKSNYGTGSLTYTLSYSETEDGTYTDVVTNQNVPRSTTETTVALASGLNIPAGKKYYYKLVITLNYLDNINQTNDLKAMLSTEFELQESNAKVTITLNTNDGVTPIENRMYTVGSSYGDLPTLTRDGYYFLGWYTDEFAGEKITSKSKVSGNKNIYVHWGYPQPLNAVLLSKINDASVTDYKSGSKGEMFTFSHEATTQTDALTDYRYIGKTPNNYIVFNNETWRIVGIFTEENESGTKEQRVKIIRNEPIGDFPWDKKADGSATTEWPTSSLNTMLNGDYLNHGGSFDYTWYNSSSIANTSKIKGLTAAARSQISPVKWYLGGSQHLSLSASDYYDIERGVSTCATEGNCEGETRSTNTIADVGLIYPSDYLYTFANGVDNQCYTDAWYCHRGWYGASWTFYSSYQWTITPFLDRSGAHSFHSDVYPSNIGEAHRTRPAVYLTSDIKTIWGDGSSTNPYILEEPSPTVVYLDFQNGEAAQMKKIYGGARRLPKLTKDGYIFDGWFTEPSGGNKITGETDFSTMANQTLYAHWIKLGFNITNDSYNFDMNVNEPKFTFTSNNQEEKSSTAKTTLTFTENRSSGLTINWTVDSEKNYDKLTITYNGNKIVNGVSGLDQSGTYTIDSISAGDTLIFEYKKDSSVNKGTDTATVELS